MAFASHVAYIWHPHCWIRTAMTSLLARLLCLIGAHDYRVIEVVIGFGPSGSVEKVECRRCGDVTTRHGER